MPALRLRGVVKRFGDLTAVDHLDLEVPKARASACSAPTAPASPRRCACSPRRRIPDEGEIEILGLKVPEQSKAARAMCGVVPQLDNLDVTLTVEQNLLVFAYLYRVPRAERKAAVERALRIANLTDRRDTKVDNLSGGMRRQAADRARPRAPAAADPARRADRRPGPAGPPGAVGADRLLRSEGVSILMSTHYIEEAERLADTVTIMSHGKAVATGRRATLIAEHAGAEAVEVYGPPAKLQEVEREAHEAGPAARAAPARRISVLGANGEPRGRAPPDEPRGRLRPAHGRGDRMTHDRRRRLVARRRHRPARAPRADGRARARDHQLLELLALVHLQRHRRADDLPAGVRLRLRLARVARVGGYDYVDFVGTGTVATAVLFSSVFPGMFGTFVKYKFQRTYDAILAAPVDTEELVTAEALWIEHPRRNLRLRADVRGDAVRARPELGDAAGPVHRVHRRLRLGVLRHLGRRPR